MDNSWTRISDRTLSIIEHGQWKPHTPFNDPLNDNLADRDAGFTPARERPKTPKKIVGLTPKRVDEKQSTLEPLSVPLNYPLKTILKKAKKAPSFPLRLIIDRFLPATPGRTGGDGRKKGRKEPYGKKTCWKCVFYTF